MPNWCNNNITISGPTETIKQLWEDAQTAHVFTVEVDGEEITKREFGLLNAMAPIGEWEYGTAVDTWGTKWDISDEGLEFTDNGDGTASIDGWFDSAWAPPIEAYNKFLDDMDNCSIEASYYEMGMDFVGRYIDGEEIHIEDVSEIVKQPEEEWPEGFADLNEHYDLLNQYEEIYEDDFEMEDE